MNTLTKIDIELGHLHGRIGLFANKHFGISDNLPTDETFKLMGEMILRQQRALVQNAKMLIEWSAEAFPADENGQVHFARALMESCAKDMIEAITPPAKPDATAQNNTKP